MANPQIQQSGSGDVTCPSTISGTSPLWEIRNSASVVIASVSTPNGWNVVLSPSSYTATVYVPLSATIGINYRVRAYWSGDTLRHVGTFDVIAYVPPTPSSTWIKRDKNIRFRYQRTKVSKS